MRNATIVLASLFVFSVGASAQAQSTTFTPRPTGPAPGFRVDTFNPSERGSEPRP